MITIIVGKTDYVQNVLLLPGSSKDLSAIVVTGKARDRSTAACYSKQRSHPGGSGLLFLQSVYQSHPGRFVCPETEKEAPYSRFDSRQQPNKELDRMAMAEIFLQLDHESPARLKEERLGVTQKGQTEDLFFLSATAGDFSFYNNLVKVPSLSEVPFLSPVSYSGLLAYKFKLLKTTQQGNHKLFTI